MYEIGTLLIIVKRLKSLTIVKCSLQLQPSCHAEGGALSCHAEGGAHTPPNTPERAAWERETGCHK